MPAFKNLDSLFEYIQKKVDTTLKNEVYKTVKKEMLANIEEEIYQSYTPLVYDRRYKSGGLGDPKNIVCEVSNGVLSVFNIAESSESWIDGTTSDDFIRWIEHGRVPMLWKGSPYPFMMPRPFLKTTKEMLEDNKKHIQALKSGLEKRGLKIQ